MFKYKRIQVYIGICFVALGFQGLSGQETKLLLRKTGLSDRNLLGIESQRNQDSGFFQTKVRSNDLPDTLRILAIRVEFQEDNNDLTTGDGKFELSTSSNRFIDPPPHDLTYFEHQLTALANYYNTVSRGKLILEFDVYPRSVNDSYTVSKQMSYFSPLDSEELLDQRLSELFQEGFKRADSSDVLNFKQFDSFILFHAGVGSDFALDFDQTPQDIPSVFLDYSTLKKHLGNDDPTYSGIAVNEGQFFIRDGIILPETQSQEDFEFGLLGTMANMFGHQLGLPNLFNTDNGRSGIGVFGLMDQGSGNFLGLLPAEPCAWSKIFLGWESPVEIRNGTGLQVAAAQTANPDKIYKIPINENEYFLLEDRFRDLNGDEIAVGQDANGIRVEFKSDSSGQRILAASTIGVITQVTEYDFGLPILLDSLNRIIPGPGILIWHIDERVIEANFAANRVNADPERRGIDLEEADGAQDIGQVYDFLSAGAGTENGTPLDAWWGSHPVITGFLRPGEPVSFSPTTRPSTHANDGSNTHIEFYDFSEPGDVMSFSVRENITLPGFPQFVGELENLTNSPLIADLDLKEDGFKEIIWSENNGTKIFVWNSDGTKFIQNVDSVQIQKFNGEVKSYPLAIFAEPPGSFSFSPAAASWNDQNAVIAVTDEVVAAYLPQDLNVDGRADSLFIIDLNEKFTTAPLVVNSETTPGEFQIIVGTENGNIYAIDSSGSLHFTANVSTGTISGFAFFPPDKIAFSENNGEIGLLTTNGNVLWRKSTNQIFTKSPVLGDLNKDGQFNVINVSDDGEIIVYEADGDTTAGFPRATNTNLASQIALVDLDGDIFLEIVFVADGQIYAYNYAGNLANQFPIQIDQNQNAGEKSSPVIVDLNEDGAQEILIGSSANRLMAYQLNGTQATAFPLSTGKAVNSTPSVADVDNDGDIEVAVLSEDGFIYVWDLPTNFKPESVEWGGYLQNAQHTNANLDLTSANPPSGELMPSNLVYNYPNPTEGTQTTIRYRLNYAAKVFIKIYDLAGELVDEFAGTGFEQVDNEVEWQLDNIESGIYLARVEAQGNGLKDVVVFKIAVVK